MMNMIRSRQALLIILIFSQFAGTSVWFATNAIVDSLPGVTPGNFATLTSSVQAGFIAGTLVFALFGVADRFASSTVFFISSVFAALANCLIIIAADNLSFLIVLRFATGFFLAGIYPVGMKIAADLFPDKIGKALGWLVGALVFGTSFPHLVRSLTTSGINWKVVLISTSALAVAGGCVVLILIRSDKKKPTTAPVKLLAAFQLFRSQNFRSVAFGYFGHMWELYAMWSMLPLLFEFYNKHNGAHLNIYFWSFMIIAIGSLGCIIGGLVSLKWGSKKLAYYALLLSGICCLIAPFSFELPLILFLGLFLIWGFSVTADSPQFSALVAKAVDEKIKGTALTIVTSIGFAITIVSIQLLKELFASYAVYTLLLLCLGPLFGLIALRTGRSE
jgi:MFS family permease